MCYVKLDLLNVLSAEEKSIVLPTQDMDSLLNGFCNPDCLKNEVVILETESDIGLDDDEFTNISQLNSTLLSIMELPAPKRQKLFEIFDISNAHGAFDLYNLLKLYDNYEIISEDKAERRTIANLVSKAVLGLELAWDLDMNNRFSESNINSLISIGLKSGVVIHKNRKFYIKDEVIVAKEVLQGNPESLEIL